MSCSICPLGVIRQLVDCSTPLWPLCVLCPLGVTRHLVDCSCLRLPPEANLGQLSSLYKWTAHLAHIAGHCRCVLSCPAKFWFPCVKFPVPSFRLQFLDLHTQAPGFSVVGLSAIPPFTTQLLHHPSAVVICLDICLLFANSTLLHSLD